MDIREYTEADLAALRQIHSRSGFDYRLPEPSREEFFSRRVVSDRTGIGMAAFLRLTAEAVLLVNHEWRTPSWRGLALTQLQTIGRNDCERAGVKEVFSFLAPPIQKQFGRRLERMGWKKYVGEEWRCYSCEV